MTWMPPLTVSPTGIYRCETCGASFRETDEKPPGCIEIQGAITEGCGYRVLQQEL